MSLIDLSCLCMFIVFAQLIESRVLILRDDDDETLVLGHVDRSSDEDVRHKHQDRPNYKPKRFHAKKTVLQHGRYIYHLDNFKDLRIKVTRRKPYSISYEYVDINDLFQVRNSAKNSVGDYHKDLVVFSNTPVQFCDGDRCDEDLRKFSKHKNDDDADWKRKKTQFGRIKRFQIVDNRHKISKTHDDSSEEHHEQKKQKSPKKIKRKKKKYSSESAESKSKESNSKEEIWEFHKKKKKKYYKPPKEENKSAEENLVQIKRKSKKKHLDDDDISVEKWMKHEKDSKTNEDFHKKKKKKKINYGPSDEITRKTFAIDDDFFIKGNKIFHAKGKRNKKHNDFDRRRRLEHFLPKRYHWDPSDIHGLGYYWFNGPKGTYAAPKLRN